MLGSKIEETGRAVARGIGICSAERLHAIGDGETDRMSTSRFWPPTTGYISEIVEENAPEVTPPPAYDEENGDVYVAVGSKNSSLDVLRWALAEIVTPGSCVFLVHIFPPVRLIPTPLGMISRKQVAPAQVEAFLRVEENKREAWLREHINLCNMFEVRAETMLVESDMIAETIVQLIEIGMIKRLVMGTSRSRLRRGNRKAEYVQKNASEDCEIRIVSNGKEVDIDRTPISPVTSFPPPPPTITCKDEEDEDEAREKKRKNQSELCKCFPSLI
ncbi:unnamed protein product [Victoria cruziana]